MDAGRLITAGRRALTEAEGAPRVLEEAWQVCALVEAVGHGIASGLDGLELLGLEEALAAPPGGEAWSPGAAAEAARTLAEAAAQAAEAVGRPPDDPDGDSDLDPAAGPDGSPGGGRGGGLDGSPGGVPRAARLTGIADPPGAARELRALLREAAEALIALACQAEEEFLYWRCINGVDALAECEELTAELLRALGCAPAVAEPDAPLAARPARFELVDPGGGRRIRSRTGRGPI